MRASSYFLMAIMAAMLVVIGISLTFDSLSAKLMPVAIAAIGVVLGMIVLGRELSRSRKKAQPVETEREKADASAKGEWRKYLMIEVWLGGFVLVISLLGFITAIPLFVFSYLKVNGRGWLMSVVMAAVVTASIYLLFTTVCGIALYRGLFFGEPFY